MFWRAPMALPNAASALSAEGAVPRSSSDQRPCVPQEHRVVGRRCVQQHCGPARSHAAQHVAHLEEAAVQPLDAQTEESARQRIEQGLALRGVGGQHIERARPDIEGAQRCARQVAQGQRGVGSIEYPRSIALPAVQHDRLLHEVQLSHGILSAPAQPGVQCRRGPGQETGRGSRRHLQRG